MLRKELSHKSTKIVKVKEAISPFGPLMLNGNIRQDTNKKIFDFVKYQLSLKPDVQDEIVVSKKNTYQANSVVNGIMQHLDYELQYKKFDDVVSIVIKDILKIYFTTYIDFVKPYIDVSQLKNDYMNVTDCWLVKMCKGDFHINHDHNTNPTVVSGALYLNVPKDLADKEPQGNIVWNLTVPGQELKNNTWTHSPKNGDWYVWPSWLPHHVYPFQSEEDRYMISFNAAFPS